MLDFFIRRPYSSFFFMLLFTFAPFAFSPNHIQPWCHGDLSVYINVAQNMFSGGVLYRDAIDTKNMGFLFLFYALYSLYARLFTTMAYFFFFQAFFLFFWYWMLMCLFYKILVMVYKPLQAWVSSIFFLAVMFLFGFMSIPSQPEIAVMIHLLYAYTVLRLSKNKGWSKYLLFGAVLGIAFAVSSPYIFITLSIPFLIWQEQGRNSVFGGFILRSGAAFCGFLLALLPFFLYFLFNNALLDWWYWNFEFTQKAYTQIHTGAARGLERAWIAFFNIFFGSVLKLSIDSINNIFFVILMYLTCILWIKMFWCKIFLKQSLGLSFEEKLLFLSTIPAILVRLTLVRYYFHYNYYLIPFMFFFFPLLLKEIRGKRLRLALGLVLSLLYAGAAFNKIFLSGLDDSYPEPLKAFIQSENSGNFSYITVNYPPIYSYSTRSRSLHYSMYDFFTPKETINRIKKLSPELILLVDSEAFSFKKIEEFQKLLDEHYNLAMETPYNRSKGEVYRLKYFVR